jgi:hypothetical protein
METILIVTVMGLSLFTGISIGGLGALVLRRMAGNG